MSTFEDSLAYLARTFRARRTRIDEATIFVRIIDSDAPFRANFEVELTRIYTGYTWLEGEGFTAEECESQPFEELFRTTVTVFRGDIAGILGGVIERDLQVLKVKK